MLLLRVRKQERAWLGWLSISPPSCFFFFPSFRRHTHTHTRTHTLSTPVPPCVLAWLTLPPHNAPLSVRQAPVDNCVYVATRAPLQKKKRNRIPFFFYIFILLPQQVLAFFSFFFLLLFLSVYSSSTRLLDSVSRLDRENAYFI